MTCGYRMAFSPPQINANPSGQTCPKGSGDVAAFFPPLCDTLTLLSTVTTSQDCWGFSSCCSCNARDTGIGEITREMETAQGARTDLEHSPENRTSGCFLTRVCGKGSICFVSLRGRPAAAHSSALENEAAICRLVFLPRPGPATGGAFGGVHLTPDPSEARGSCLHR